MNSEILNKYFGNASVQQRNELLDLFTGLEAVRNAFYGFIIEEGGKYQFGYASLSITTLTGHDYANFSYDGGSPFCATGVLGADEDSRQHDHADTGERGPHPVVAQETGVHRRAELVAEAGDVSSRQTHSDRRRSPFVRGAARVLPDALLALRRSDHRKPAAAGTTLQNNRAAPGGACDRLG